MRLLDVPRLARPAHVQLTRTDEPPEGAFACAAAPLLAELRQAGIDTAGFGQFYTARWAKTFGAPPPFDTRRALPILLEWLPRIGDEPVKAAIVAHLENEKAAREVALPLLVAEYERAPEGFGGLRWQIGSALERLADDRVFDDLVRLARDRRYGRDREMVVAALGNVKDARAVGILIELLDDDDVAGHALWGLRKLAPPEARAHVERFVDHPRTWWRNEAKKALAKIDRRAR